MLMRAQVQLEAPPPPALPDFITQHIDPFSGDDDSADIDAVDRRDPVAACRRSAFREPDMPVGPAPSSPCASRSAATRRARAGRAGSTSIATASSPDSGAAGGWRRSTGPRCAAPIAPDEEAVVAERLAEAKLDAAAAREAAAIAARAGQGRARATSRPGSTPSCTPTTSAATRASR